MSNLASSEKCQYKNKSYNFTCDESTKDTDSEFCIFHDINYLKDDNYEKHKEKVANRFKGKLREYSSNDMPFNFTGYRLPEISFENNEFRQPLYFIGATFYGTTDFNGANFYNLAIFSEAEVLRETKFSRAKFYEQARLYKAKFSEYEVLIQLPSPT